MTAYAADESERAELGIRFVSMLPKLTPATDIGAPAVTAYARRSGLDEATFVSQLGPRSRQHRKRLQQRCPSGRAV